MNERTATPTLDAVRTDQLRTFLTVEAAADAAATTHRPARHGRRRLVGGIAAALLLAGVLFAVAAVTGGPGPASVDPAVAIETTDGWTTIRLLDAEADPAAVVAELEAAGIDAKAVSRADAEAAMEQQGFSIHFTSFTGHDGELEALDEGTSLSVSLPDPFPEMDRDLEGAAFQDALTQTLEDSGIRFDSALEPGTTDESAPLSSVSIKAGSGRTVLVISPN